MVNNDKVLYDDFIEESERLDAEYRRIFNEDSNPFETLKMFRKSIGAKQDFLKDKIVYFLIDAFTLRDNEEKFRSIFKLSSLYGDISVYKKENSIIIKTDEYEIEARKITDLFPDVIDKLSKNIETDNRQNMCHELSSSLAFELNQDNNLVTSYTYGFTDKSKYLHTYVETIIDGKEYILDPTINAVINKDGFFKMHHITESDVISVVSQKALKNDFAKVINALDLDDRNIAVFGNEIFGELSKLEEKGFKL